MQSEVGWMVFIELQVMFENIFYKILLDTFGSKTELVTAARIALAAESRFGKTSERVSRTKIV
jgi:hypothetical protein